MGFLIIKAINIVFYVINLLIFVRVLFSWIPDFNPYKNKITELIYDVTEVILAPIRRLLDSFGLLGMIDISPIIAIFLLRILQKILITIFLPIPMGF